MPTIGTPPGESPRAGIEQDVRASDMEIDISLRSALREQLGVDRYELWFGKGIRFELSGDQVVAIVPTTFLQEWLRRNFRTLLETTATRVLDRQVTLAIQVAPNLGATVSGASPCGTNRPNCTKLPTDHGQVGETPPPVTIPVVPVSLFATAHAHQAATQASLGTSTVSAPRGSRTGQDPAAAAGTSFRRRFAHFNSFVVGETNRLAWTSAQMASDRLGSLSPLLLHGPTGVGKTHLLEAIWSRVRQGEQRTRAVYLTAEQFTSYFVDAVRHSGLPSFRRKYRGVDLLLIDDLQFFSGKRATLVELLYTINTLVDEGRQIVLSADRPPSELGDLGRELINRLQGGMVCRIDAPDYEVRLGIVRQLAAAAGLELAPETANFVACQVTTDARGLAGAVNQLTATQLSLGVPITLSIAQGALSELIRHSVRSIRLRDIESAICDVFGLDPACLQSSRRTKDVTQPRMLAMWLARKHTRAALSEIGSYFGGRSHSTVISAQQKVGGWMGEQATLRIADAQCSVDEAIRRVEKKLMG